MSRMHGGAHILERSLEKKIHRGPLIGGKVFLKGRRVYTY